MFTPVVESMKRGLICAREAHSHIQKHKRGNASPSRSPLTVPPRRSPKVIETSVYGALF